MYEPRCGTILRRDKVIRRRRQLDTDNALTRCYSIDSDPKWQQLVCQSRSKMAYSTLGEEVREREARSSSILSYHSVPETLDPKQLWSHLGPTIHTARHDDLRHEFPRSRLVRVLPLLKQGQECDAHPVRTDRIRAYRVIEVLRIYRVEEIADERGRGSLSRSVEFATTNSSVVE